MKHIFAALLALFMLALAGTPGFAQEAVVITVNDHPITGFDVDQRIKLMEFMGEKDPAKLTRKAVASALVDDYIKIDEATLAKINPTEKEIDDRLRQMAQGMKTDDAGLKSKLASAGLTITGLRQYASAQMSLGRLLQAKYHEKVALQPGDVDKKMATIKSEIDAQVAKVKADPRRQPVKVVSLQEVNFPVDGEDPQLLQSRAIEAGQAAQKIKSCDAIRPAVAGIFNVQIGKKIEADGRKLPPKLVEQMNARGLGHAIGPMRYPKGIQLLVYCGNRTITPPPLNVQYPTRQQVENAALNDKYAAVEGKYTALMRKNAIIEYKDPSYAP
ncbi:MAG: SurA N-terminal domain-containing protein [Alphaproteobacteria bacterium]|nr:SurA N-terminal domain-containing protein [Alphaproteobacteria bacterium]